MVQTLRNAFVEGIVRVGYSPIFFYYELLIRCSKIIQLIINYPFAYKITGDQSYIKLMDN